MGVRRIVFTAFFHRLSSSPEFHRCLTCIAWTESRLEQSTHERQRITETVDIFTWSRRWEYAAAGPNHVDEPLASKPMRRVHWLTQTRASFDFYSICGHTIGYLSGIREIDIEIPHEGTGRRGMGGGKSLSDWRTLRSCEWKARTMNKKKKIK